MIFKFKVIKQTLLIKVPWNNLYTYLHMNTTSVNHARRQPACQEQLARRSWGLNKQPSGDEATRSTSS